jgi:hypothetical protein
MLCNEKKINEDITFIWQKLMPFLHPAEKSESNFDPMTWTNFLIVVSLIQNIFNF